MNRIKFLPLIFLGLWACNDKSKNNMDSQSTEQSADSAHPVDHNIQLQYNTPMVLDSSDWILYPLTVKEAEKAGSGGYISSASGRQNVFWNIAFYNIRTKQTKLLSDSLKMLVHSIIPMNDTTTTSDQPNTNKKAHIFYTITTKDFNQDGKLDDTDPEYLFVSDLSGQMFRQITPDHLDLTHWQYIEGKNKVIIQARKDVNKDLKFDEKDEMVSYIYDVNHQYINEIFSNEFNEMTIKLLISQWSKKK